MGDVENLGTEAGREKIKHIAQGEIAMFGTSTGTAASAFRPMATQGIDDDGTLWFFSHRTSDKNRQIAAHPTVQLLYAVGGKSEYLSVEGVATISRDQAKIDELWSGWAKTWFNEGKEDPNLTLISVRPTAGHYWDTKHNKMVQLAKIAVGAVIGKTMDDGVEGDLGVR